MLSTSPTLYIRRPSPTTAEYTVTTRPPSTLPLRLALLSLTTLRLLATLAVLIALHTRFSSSLPSYPLLEHLHALGASSPGQVLAQLTAPLPGWALLGGALAMLYLCLLWSLHTTERLLVLRGLGMQTSTTGQGLWGAWRPATRFIPTEKIRDVLINEAFRGFEVRYYLVVVVEGEEDVVVVFPRLLPRRKIVEAVWRGVRGCLYEAPMEGGGWNGVREKN